MKIKIILKENKLNEKEFSPKLGWQKIESESVADDIIYPQEEDFIEETPLTLSFDKIENVAIGVINMTPVSTVPTLFEEYVIDTEQELNPLVGFNRMKRHIAKGRAVNFGFTAIRDGKQVNVLFVSVDGDEPRMFVRML